MRPATVRIRLTSKRLRISPEATGSRVEETHAARRTVVVSGTVAQFNRAFDVTLQNYEHEVERSSRSVRRTERYHSYDGFIDVPADLAEIIVGVFGLD